MDVKFFDSLFEGDSPNGVKLGMGITGGDFWPRPVDCHTLYRGQDGDFNYEDICAVMSIADTQVSVPNQDLPAEAIWHFIRRQVSDCGLESPDSDPCIVRIDHDGVMILNAPNPPTCLTAELLSAGRIKLRWRYNRIDQVIEPTGFYIYQDSGSGFDLDTPTGTASYAGQNEFNWTSANLTNGQLYSFIVRSYKTNQGEDQNMRIVSARADAQGPPAIDDIYATWEII